jgi:hypothetical protein
MNEYVLSSNSIQIPSEIVCSDCGVNKTFYTVKKDDEVTFCTNFGSSVGTVDVLYEINSIGTPVNVHILYNGNNYNTGELSYSLKVGSQTSTNKILANAQWVYKRVNGLGVFDVTGGNVNVDLTRTQGIFNEDPSMQYIFIPKTSRVQAGYFQPISGENVNNTPSANSNRFSINLPANIGAGQLILLGNMNMWRNSAAADLGYNVNITTASTSNALVTTATFFNAIAANAQEQIPFFTKYDITSTAANSVIHIDYVPNTTFSGVGAPRLAWVFIPN